MEVQQKCALSHEALEDSHDLILVKALAWPSEAAIHIVVNPPGILNDGEKICPGYHDQIAL